MSPISFNPNLSPLFGHDKGKSHGGHLKKSTAPDVTHNHRKKYKVRDIVHFKTGNFMLSDLGKGKGLAWQKNHEKPTVNFFA